MNVADQSMLAVSARPPSNPGYIYGTSTPPVTQYPSIGHSDSPVLDHHTQSPHHFGAGPPGYHQPTTVFYGPQRASPAFGFVDQHGPATAAAGFLVSSSSQPAEEPCPRPIPLPSEVPRGQSLTITGSFESQELPTPALVSYVTDGHVHNVFSNSVIQ